MIASLTGVCVCGREYSDHYSMPTIDPDALFCSKYANDRYAPRPATPMTAEARVAANGIRDPLTLKQSTERVTTLANLGYTEAIVVTDLLARVKKLEAEIQELRTAAAHPWFCPDCGPGVAIDEDGCCATCGEDAVEEKT